MQVGYRPTENNSREEFLKYAEELGRIPYLLLVKNDSFDRNIFTKDYEKLIHDLADVFSAMNEMDFANFKRSIKNTVTNLLSSKKGKEKRVFFGQFIVSNQGPDIYVGVYHTTLDLTIDETGKRTFVSQKMTVNHTLYQLNSGKMIVDAEILANFDKKRIEDWVNGMASVKNPTVTPCAPFMNAIDRPQIAQKFIKKD